MSSRATCFERWTAAKENAGAKEVEFYGARVSAYEALIARCGVADRLQDAEEEDDEEEE